MHRPNLVLLASLGSAAASFLVGIGCEAYWNTPAPITGSDQTRTVAVVDRPAASPLEEAPASETPTTAPAAPSPVDPWTQAAQEGNRLRRAHRFENLGASLTALDPQEALRVIAEIPTYADQMGLLRGFFEELAQGSNASVAIKIAMSIDSRPEREAALAALVDCWTADAPDSLRDRARLVADNYPEAGLGMELLDADPPNLELAISWAAQIKEADGRATLLAAIAHKLVSADPTAALALGSTLTGNHYVEFLRSTLQSWAQSDPASALAWTAQITDSEIRKMAQESVGSGWAEMDDEHTSLAYLATVPPGPARTRFIRATMQTLQASYSADEVSAWIAELNDPADRAAAQALVEDAPTPVTGIGARLNLDNGTVLVSSLVADSPAAQGGIKEGDRILAVAQPGELWLPVSGIDFDGIAAIIRGAASSTVQLQVASPQPGGYGPPHSVQLTRAPIDPHH